MEIVKDLVAFELPVSAAWTVIVADSTRVGVPLIDPEFESVNPSGNAPAVKLQLYGPIPPAAFRTAVYAANVVPSGNVPAVVMISPALTSSRNCCVATCWGLPPAASTVKSNVPTDVGVPLMSPVDDNEIPGGKFPDETDHVNPILVDA